jgi:cysteine-rich repeat protein
VPPTGTADYPAEVEQNNLKSTANLLQPATKGFTASLWPLGDVDFFRFDVTVPNSTVAVTTSDGQGSCPAGAQTYVRVTDGAHVIGYADGTSGCVSLQPNVISTLTGLAAGTYYVEIESADLTTVPRYVVDIKVSAPGCGDGIVQVSAGEQCDDGNTASGDGCSSTCQVEGKDYVFETEPNDTQATGNPLAGHDGAVGAINPTGDVDWYEIDVTVAGSSVSAVVSDGLGGCPSGFDSKLYLYGPAGTMIISDDNGAGGLCSKIAPANHAEAKNLPVGSYGLKVEYFGGGKTAPSYVLDAKVSPPGCGDGVLQAGEQCDDGNTVNGDGCSSTCQFEKSYASETEPNGTFAQATPLPTGAAGFLGAISPLADWDYYSFTVTVPGSSVVLDTSDGLGGCPSGFDSVLDLYDGAHNTLATNDAGLVQPCSTIWYANSAAASNMAVGTYFVRVRYYSDVGTSPQYVLGIKVIPPGCGDGTVQPGEQCDDGNTVGGDGCSATCASEAPSETEPNNATTTANALWPGTSTWRGSISPLGDHDYFTFTLPAVGSPTLVTHAVGNASACTFDTVLHLLDHNGTQISTDDDTGPGACSSIDPVHHPEVHNIPAGVYYVWVQASNDQTVIPAYQLDLTIQ